MGNLRNFSWQCGRILCVLLWLLSTGSLCAFQWYLYWEGQLCQRWEIDKLRHSTTALLERNDVIVVASVSCIYGLGSPKEYSDSVVSLRPGLEISRINFSMIWWISSLSVMILIFSGEIPCAWDVVEIFPASRDEHAFRVRNFSEMKLTAFEK